jgi:hypothetical protein
MTPASTLWFVTFCMMRFLWTTVRIKPWSGFLSWRTQALTPQLTLGQFDVKTCMTGPKAFFDTNVLL